jgi:hypothetical protein
MPFINEIVTIINDELKGGSLNKEKLQPANFYGLSTQIVRKKGSDTEQLPAIVTADGKIEVIAPDAKYALQVYHKCQDKSYSYEKKGSVGDSYYIKMIADMQMIVILNTKRSARTKDLLEPLIMFGMPQRLTAAVMGDLQLNNSLIRPFASILDQFQVAKSEYPNSGYFFNEQICCFMIRYKIETIFSQACIDACLCQP